VDTIIEMLKSRFEHLLGRASGPLHFRLFIMPIVVTVLAIRAHLRDVREGKPTSLWAILKSPTERRRRFRSGLKDIGKVFIVACVLDTTYQLLVLRSFYLGEMLVVAVVCAIVPYFLVRGPVMRIACLLRAKTNEILPGRKLGLDAANRPLVESAPKAGVARNSKAKAVKDER
jgi:hypothetical protein